MTPHKLAIKFTLGEFCFDIKFNTKMENLFSQIESRTNELKFDISISSKNELVIITNTKFLKSTFINEFNMLLESLPDSETKELLLRSVSLKYKLEQQQVNDFKPIEFTNWTSFVYEINSIDPNYYL